MYASISTLAYGMYSSWTQLIPTQALAQMQAHKGILNVHRCKQHSICAHTNCVVHRYVSECAEHTRAACIVVPDMFGFDAQHTRKLVDKLAQCGILAALVRALCTCAAECERLLYSKPDVFYCRPWRGLVDDRDGFAEWLSTHPPDRILADINKTAMFLRHIKGADSIGVVGMSAH
jgi:hypothetical protein